MLISDKHKIIYIAHESTASRSISQYLSLNFEAEVKTNKHDPTIESIINQFGKQYAESLKDYLKFTLVRHPLTRLFSIWDRCHIYEEPNIATPGKYGWTTFEEFVDRIIMFKEKGQRIGLEIYTLNNVMMYVPRSQTEEINRFIYEIDHILKYENLPECLKILGESKYELPHLGIGNKEKNYSAEYAKKVSIAYPEDYERFDYAI